MVVFLNVSSVETPGENEPQECVQGGQAELKLLRSFFCCGSPSIPAPHRDVQMEAGGDTAAPVPGDAEDLEEMRFPSEEAEDGEGIHKDLPDPGDASLEKAGIHSLHEGLGIPRGYYSWGRFLGTQREESLGLREVV